MFPKPAYANASTSIKKLDKTFVDGLLKSKNLSKFDLENFLLNTRLKLSIQIPVKLITTIVCVIVINSGSWKLEKTSTFT